MVNKIISQAQHILWAPAILLFLPPVALFTKKRCFVYFERVQKRPFLPGAKRNEKKSFLFFFLGELKAMKTILCSIFELISISKATWGRSGLLRPTSSQGEGQTLTGTQTQEQTLFHPLQHPRHSLSSLAPPRLSQGKGKNCHKETENKTKQKFLHSFLAFFPPFFLCFKACNSLLCPRVN